MGFRTEVRTFIKKIEQFISAEGNSTNLIILLQKENDALRKQNELLFDRLMARNFEEFAHLKTEEYSATEIKALDFDQDDGIAGEVVDETQ